MFDGCIFQQLGNQCLAIRVNDEGGGVSEGRRVFVPHINNLSPESITPL